MTSFSLRRLLLRKSLALKSRGRRLLMREYQYTTTTILENVDETTRRSGETGVGRERGDVMTGERKEGAGMSGMISMEETDTGRGRRRRTDTGMTDMQEMREVETRNRLEVARSLFPTLTSLLSQWRKGREASRLKTRS